MIRSLLLVNLWTHLIQGASSISSARPPSSWPGAFYVPFITNVTLNDANDAIQNGIQSKMYYDYTDYSSQLVVHGSGVLECIKFYGAYDGCSLLFTANNL